MIGLAAPLIAQLCSIFYVLKMAWEIGKHNLIFEIECAEVLDHILHPEANFPVSGLVIIMNNLRRKA